MTQVKPYYEDSHCTIYHGEARAIVPLLPRVHLILTDPPYSSGGIMRSDRNVQTSDKYVMTGTEVIRPEFSGDNRDQRSFLLWCELWLRDLLRFNACKSTVVASFIDWRQLPVMIDAFQVAGWVYRGLLVWDKTEAARPQKGWFRAQAEYVVLGSAGPLEASIDGQCSPGVFRCAVNSAGQKLHITEKPVPLLSRIIQTSPKFQTILDPFMGGGSTLRAAKDLGRRAIGIEMEESYCEIAARRLEQEAMNFQPPATPLQGAV